MNTRVTKNPSEFLKSVTSHTSRHHLSAWSSIEEKHQQLKTSQDVKQDVEAQQPTEDTFEETTSIQSE